MPVSVITGITQEDQPQELSSFLRSGVAYVFWATPVLGLQRRIRWKPHNSGDYTEVIPSLLHLYQDVSCLYDPSSDNLVVVWGDGSEADGVANGNLYIARFNPVTAALVSGPTPLFQGSKARLCYISTAQSSKFLLYYKTAKNRGVYGRRSEDGGLTWGNSYPLITGQVSGTSAIEVVPYDGAHVSVSQLGSGPKTLREAGMLQRTRPLTSIVNHPTLAGQFFIGEPSKFDNTTLTDNLRGALVAATDGSKLYHLDGVAQGTSDSIGSVALVTDTATVLSVGASAGPTGNGDDLNTYTLTPSSIAINVDLPGASCAVGMAVTPSYGYVAEYSDSSAVLGQFIVVDLATGTTGTVFTGVTGVRAVGVANFLTPKLIFVASTESGIERLRVYEENALTPNLLLNTKLTSRANAITIAADASNPAGALIYVSCVDRVNVYRYTNSSTPVLLVDSLSLPGGNGGSFFQLKIATNGNVVAAVGNTGVVVFDSTGKTLAHSPVSGKPVPDWVPSKAYALNDLVKPRSSHPFSRSRTYFKATTAGTSGISEPSWVIDITAGTVLDAGARWTPVGLTDGIATGIALDETTHRIYAAGTAGGVLGTDGRIWVMDAKGLI